MLYYIFWKSVHSADTIRGEIRIVKNIRSNFAFFVEMLNMEQSLPPSAAGGRVRDLPAAGIRHSAAEEA